MGQAQQKHSSPSDSIFGMALSQAFMGVAFGAGVDMAWEACEMADAVYVDRQPKSQKNSPTFEMGKPKSLLGFFDVSASANKDSAPKAPAPAPALFDFGYDRKTPSPSSFGFSMAA